MEKTIVLSADYGYINQITTTIKSILYHNQRVHIYIINEDIPPEWFYNINRRVGPLRSHISDLKINPAALANEISARPYINKMTFGRLLIPRLLKEDRILYLDSDVVVNGSLDDLFTLELGSHPLAAVTDIALSPFNAGVLLLNNRLLRQQPELVDQMLAKGAESKLKDADQTILNDFFADSFLPLDFKFNYAIGSDQLIFYDPTMSNEYNDLINSVSNPVIVHYTSEYKPWKLTSGGRMRSLWWQYYDLDWYEIATHAPLRATRQPVDHHALIFARDDQLAHLPEIVKQLPNVAFHVAAWTEMTGQLLSHSNLPNLYLYPSIAGPLLEQLVNRADYYLDIEQNGKETQFAKRMMNDGKPVLAFENTKFKPFANQPNYHIVPTDDVNAFANFLKNYN